MPDKLFQHIQKYIDLSANDELVINKYINTLHLKKKEFCYWKAMCAKIYTLLKKAV